MNEWQKEYSESEKGMFYKQIEDKVYCKVKYKERNRKKEVMITRLRLGKCKLNDYLHKLGLHANGLCDVCQQPERIQHFLMQCKISDIGPCLEQRCKSLGSKYTLQTILSTEVILNYTYELNNRDL